MVLIKQVDRMAFATVCMSDFVTEWRATSCPSDKRLRDRMEFTLKYQLHLKHYCIFVYKTTLHTREDIVYDVLYEHHEADL